MPNRLAIATNLNPSIIALKPRQVLLANANAIPHSTMSDSKSSSSLKADQKTLLLSSLSQYLERNGFSRTVKKLRSEAQIEKDGIKDAPPNLEEIFKKYFETCNHDASANSQKEQVAQKDVISKAEEGVAVISVEALSKKKKKSKGNDDCAVVGQCKAADSKKSEEMITSSTASELNGKTKEKKKSKKISDSLGQGTEHLSSEAPEEPAQNTVGESLLEEPNKKDEEKKKKKKKNKVSPESLCGNGENHLELEGKDISNKSKDKKKKKDKLSSDSLIEKSNNEKDNIKSDAVDVATKETKASKKRKRLASEENDSKLVDEKAIEESKLGKPGIDANTASENGQVGSDETGNTPMKQLKGCDDKNIDRSVEKSAKKQRIGSAEPTTLKAFQRVKVDEVVFTDERLQDNSYWAKDGAESGYGAKAQEVLGQVRGRDFRHEKTKKKRGSYRGGQIDLQSHSVKFNYSDEE